MGRRRDIPAGAGLVDGGLRRGRLRLPGARPGTPAGPSSAGPGARAGSSRRCPHCAARTAHREVTESAPLDPRNAYAVSKVAQEQLAGVWAGMTGGRAVALRYHNVYGPRMPRDTPYSGVAAIFRSALEAGRAPRVFEDGAQQRDFVHVRGRRGGEPGRAGRRPGRAAAGLQHGQRRDHTRSARWPGRWPRHSAARAGGDRRVPARRRPARRCFARAGPGRAGIPARRPGSAPGWPSSRRARLREPAGSSSSAPAVVTGGRWSACQIRSPEGDGSAA